MLLVLLTTVTAPVPSGCTGLGGDAGIEVPENQIQTAAHDGDNQDRTAHLGDTEGTGDGIDETARSQPLEREEGSETAGKTLEPVGRGETLEGVLNAGQTTGEVGKLDKRTSTSHIITLEKGEKPP